MTTIEEKRKMGNGLMASVRELMADQDSENNPILIPYLNRLVEECGMRSLNCHNPFYMDMGNSGDRATVVAIKVRTYYGPQTVWGRFDGHELPSGEISPEVKFTHFVCENDGRWETIVSHKERDS